MTTSSTTGFRRIGSFSPGTPVFPSPQKLTLPNSYLERHVPDHVNVTRLNEFLRTPMCFVGKQEIYYYYYYFTTMEFIDLYD